MTELLLSQAQTWGFVCEAGLYNNWQILPRERTPTWKLQLVGDRWLLLVNNVPQISFCWQEAIAFLELRRVKSRKS